MDNITHSLVGLMLARAGLNRGEKGGAVMVVLAANVPDIDGYSFFIDPLTYLEQHRAYMHALPFVPLVALIPLFLVKLVTGTRVTLWPYFACVVGVLSHLVLDWTNVYGVRLLLPFSARWFHLDINPLSEAMILSILVLSWGIPAVLRLIGGEVRGETRGRTLTTPTRAWAWFALLAVMTWDAGRWAAHQRAISMMASESYDVPIERIGAFPAQFSFSPLFWHGIVAGKDMIYEMPVDVTERLDPTTRRIHYAPEHTPVNDLAIDAARDTRPFRVFEDFDQFPFWRLTKQQNAIQVELLDLRFGSLNIPGFRAVALVRTGGAVLDSSFMFGGR